jgi:hypothetical protein
MIHKPDLDICTWHIVGSDIPALLVGCRESLGKNVIDRVATERVPIGGIVGFETADFKKLQAQNGVLHET